MSSAFTSGPEPRPVRSDAAAGVRTDQVRGLELLRWRIAARYARLTQREYWSSWMVYLLLGPYMGWLGLRHRDMTACAAANPGIPFGGFVGESKWDILRRLNPEAIIPTALVPPGEPAAQAASLEAIVAERGWSWPIILKPDVGERGAGVRLIAGAEQARTYFKSHRTLTLAQKFDPGPFEAGVFYARMPDEEHGRIFSVTDKRFSSVIGDGRSTVRTLIWRHPRYRAQAPMFLRRLGGRADRIPGAGEAVALGVAGNHCQGTMFLDGAHFITPELTAAVDRAINHPGGDGGLYFGRLDVRYADPAEFKAGRGFRVIEFNGVMSESTNIYDPGMGYWRALGILMHQWRLAFAIGAANRRRGVPKTNLWELLREVRAHVKRRDVDTTAD